MLDVFGILVSGAAMLFVIFRAVQLDIVQPWFQSAPPEQDAAAAPPSQAGRTAGRQARVQPVPPWRRR